MLNTIKTINSKYQIKKKFYLFLSSVVEFFLGLRFFERWASEFTHYLNKCYKEVKHGKYVMKFSVTNPLLLYRINTFATKEPETLEWIESMNSEDVLFDVGANIGLYSIYASNFVKKVYAFEPEASNYYLLNKNLDLNGFDSVVKGYNLAISDKSKICELELNDLTPGAALHQVASEISSGSDFVFRQACFVKTLDELCYHDEFEIPTHLKIDVDGHESKVIWGSKKLLKDKKLKSILVELDDLLEADLEIFSILKESGFKLQSTGEKIKTTNAIIGNYLFIRE